jgi:hypothetical protein
MNRLKREFEEQLRVSVTGDGKVRVGTPTTKGRVTQGEAFSPVDILRADQQVYEAEAERWLLQHWLPPRLALLEKQLDLPDNRNRFADLRSRLAKHMVVPFVGAGMSRASGLPDWADLLRKLRQCSDCEEAELETLLATWQYEAAAELLHRTAWPIAFDEKINHLCRVERHKLAGPILLLPSLFQRQLITTNFDRVLEDVYAEEGAEIGQVFSGANLRTFQVQRDNTRTLLLKLHGSYDDPESRVFTPAEYAAAYQPTGPLIAELQNAARNNTLLFLGASLYTDRTVTVLREMASRTVNGPAHYAFLPFIPDAAARKQRERELTGCRIFPIWFEPVPPQMPGGKTDYDLPVEALLVGLFPQEKLFVRH